MSIAEPSLFSQITVRAELAHLVTPTAPPRRCADCALDLGPAIHAAFSCPLFGRPRHGVEIHCLAFVPRSPRPNLDNPRRDPR